MTTENHYRSLTSDEITLLESLGNSCSNWELVFITDRTDLRRITGNHFEGRIRIGTLQGKNAHTEQPFIRDNYLSHVTLGNQCHIVHVKRLHHFYIGDGTELFNIGDMDGSDPFAPFKIAVANENGGRAIMAFPGMTAADAWLMAGHRHDETLHSRLEAMSLSTFMDMPDHGTTGTRVVIRNVQSISGCYIGDGCLIENVTQLKNCCIQSTEEARTVIANGVIAEDAFTAPGGGWQNNAIIQRVACGENVHLENGARVIDCYIGDNSTVACAEIVSNLLFPFHEQHHNNSFLIACTLLGQSNIGAGATIGSNHNSRSADGEILAGRGFWPGLESDFKHNSHFASYCLVAKGSYESELHIHLPFSLVSKNPDGITVYPAYWYSHNMYALARNSGKFRKRDKRTRPVHDIETDFLAPDTVWEMTQALQWLKQQCHIQETYLELLSNTPAGPSSIITDSMAHKQKAVILKPLKGMASYIKMLIAFTARRLIASSGIRPSASLPDVSPWENFGGQLIPAAGAELLRKTIRNGQSISWKQVHDIYRQYQNSYANTLDVLAWSVAAFLLEKETVSNKDLTRLIRLAPPVFEEMRNHALNSRAKDFKHPYRIQSYLNKEEMYRVLGKPDDDPYLLEFVQQCVDWIEKTEEYIIQHGE